MWREGRSPDRNMTACGELRRRLAAQCRMRPRLVIVPPPLGAQDPCLQFGGKFLPVPELVPQPAVKGLAVGVLPRAPRGDVERLHTLRHEPSLQRPGDEHRAIVAPQVLRRTSLPDQSVHHLDDLLGPDLSGHVDRQTLPGVFVHHAQQLQSSAIPGSVPGRSRSSTPDPDARPATASCLIHGSPNGCACAASGPLSGLLHATTAEPACH